MLLKIFLKYEYMNPTLE